MKGFEKRTRSSEVTESRNKTVIDGRTNKPIKLPKFYVKYYAEERETFKGFLKNGRDHVITMIVSVIVVFIACVVLIGNGAYTYSDDTYRNIEDAMNEFARSERTINDLKTLDDAVGDVKYTYDKGKFKLVCNTRNGFFNAKVTTWLTNDTALQPALNRNFHSRNMYMIFFWGVFGCTLVIGSYLVWYIINRFCYCTEIIVKTFEWIHKIDPPNKEAKGKKAEETKYEEEDEDITMLIES